MEEIVRVQNFLLEDVGKRIGGISYGKIIGSIWYWVKNTKKEPIVPNIPLE